MDITTGRQRPDESEASYRIRAQAFQARLRPYDPDMPVVADDQFHVARLDGRLVATVVTVPERQWFGGRAVPMGAISGVAVLPDARGLGLARRLMVEAIEAMRDRGEVLSSLYPTTSSLYRSVGYEFGGRLEPTWVDLSGAVTGSRSTAEPDRYRMEPLGPELARMRPLYDEVAARSNGWLGRSHLYWQRKEHFGDPSKHQSFGYLIHEDDRPVAALHITHTESRHRVKFDVEVDGPYAVDAHAFRAALDLLLALDTTVDRISLNLPVESLALHLPGALIDHRDSWLWMLRLVDVVGALEGRGYNPAVEARFTLDIDDPIAPWNAGCHRVEVTGGRALVEKLTSTPAGPTVSLDVQTLAGLYTGFADPVELAAAGRLPGADPATLNGLAAAFSGPPPRLVDHF